MDQICAASCQAIPNIFMLPVKDGVTSAKSLADNTRQEKMRSLIADAKACLRSIEAGKAAKHRISQTALQSIRSELSGDAVVFDAALSEMAILQYQVTQLCLRVQQSRIKSNNESQHELSLKNVEKMQEAIDQAVKSKAAQEKMGFWGKLSNVLGLAAAVIGIVLAPFTGGLSLLATGYLVVDLGLQIGEQASGIKMSIESGLEKGIKAFLSLLPENILSEAQRDLIAGIVSSIVGMVIAIGMSLISGGASAAKVISALQKISKVLPAVAPKVSMGVQGTTHVAAAATGITGGTYGVENANSEYSLNGIEVQRTDLNKRRELLLDAFEQCKEDMQKILEGMQHELSQVGDMLANYYDGAARVIDSMAKVRHAA
ncbi:hypothetical protein D9O50_04610 [Oxalobacteraceae bacterium CAVE-383]|nr:hypothetical protein D9O50_04610 [Oxalobacteraceae bacterium CAVE-383]